MRRDALVTFSSRLFAQIVALCVSLITARTLAPAGRGEFVLLTNLFAFLLAFGSIGQAQAVVYLVGRHRHQAGEILSNALAGAALTGPLVLGGAVVTMPWLTSSLGIANERLPLILCAYLPIALAAMYMQHGLLGLQRITDYNLLANLQWLVYLVALVFSVVVLGAGVSGAVFAFLAAYAVTAIAAVLKLLPALRGTLGFNWRLFKTSLAYGARAWLSNTSVFFNLKLDAFLVAYFLTLSQVGQYSVAVAITQGAWILPGAVATVVFSRSSGSAHEEMNRLTPTVCRMTLATTLVLVIGMGALARPLVEVLFGAAYASASTALVLLLPGVLAYAVHQVLFSDLAGRGKPGVGALSALVGLAVTLALDVALIPTAGIAGAAIASSIAYVAMTSVTLFFFLKETRVPVADVLLPRPAELQSFAADVYKRVANSLAGREGSAR